MRRSGRLEASSFLSSPAHLLTNLLARGSQYPALEKIEADNLAIQRERAGIVARRRYQDDADDAALLTGAAVPTTFPPPPRDERPTLDEAVALAPRSSARAARRAAREERIVSDFSRLTALCSALTKSLACPAQSQSNGATTDDELDPTDATDLAAAVSDLRAQLAALFADVKAPDFRDPNLGIRRRFEDWRSRFGEEYGHAFGGLAMVGVWEFWARVEMGLWNPFEVSCHSCVPAKLQKKLTGPFLRSSSSHPPRPAWTRTSGTRPSRRTGSPRARTARTPRPRTRARRS